jgi:HPt (histidine-containing phosphotransfer) domain-containing protein
VASDAEALDYQAVVARCMGQHELANRLIGKFLDNLDEEIARIKRLLHKQDWTRASQAAHKVKGAAAVLEAKRLRACLEDLERNLRQGATVDVPAVSARLDHTSREYRDAAETMLQDRN